MTILVTGAAGFIGSHTAERLLELGHTVYGVDNFSDYYDVSLKRMNSQAVEKSGGKMITMDLRNPGEYAKLPTDVHYIFHFAAQPGLSNNIIATKYLIDYALELEKLEMFVNIGTSSIYGLEATYPEDKAPKPASFYGVTKLAAEQLVLQKSRENIMKSCSLRLYSVIGPRERPEKMYTKLIACGLHDKSFPLYEGSEKHLRSFTYIGDIVDGVVSVIGRANKVNGEVINLGTEAEYTTQQGIEAVEQVLGKSISIHVIPKRPGDQLRTCAIIDKARELLDYDPQTSLLDSVRFQADWYIRNFSKA